MNAIKNNPTWIVDGNYPTALINNYVKAVLNHTWENELINGRPAHASKLLLKKISKSRINQSHWGTKGIRRGARYTNVAGRGKYDIGRYLKGDPFCVKNKDVRTTPWLNVFINNDHRWGEYIQNSIVLNNKQDPYFSIRAYFYMDLFMKYDNADWYGLNRTNLGTTIIKLNSAEEVLLYCSDYTENIIFWVNDLFSSYKSCGFGIYNDLSAPIDKRYPTKIICNYESYGISNVDELTPDNIIEWTPNYVGKFEAVKIVKRQFKE